MHTYPPTPMTNTIQTINNVIEKIRVLETEKMDPMQQVVFRHCKQLQKSIIEESSMKFTPDEWELGVLAMLAATTTDLGAPNLLKNGKFLKKIWDRTEDALLRYFDGDESALRFTRLPEMLFWSYLNTLKGFGFKGVAMAEFKALMRGEEFDFEEYARNCVESMRADHNN